MSLFHGRARQPEIIRTVQKDLHFTDELTSDFSAIFSLANSRLLVRYNHLCKVLAEITYHGFASLNNLQTLGEEYTGIIQVDSRFISLPSKLLQLTSIALEFGGDTLYLRLLQNLEKRVREHDDILPEAKLKLYKLLAFMKASGPYIKAFHKSAFYLGSNKYQLSKRLTGINYVLIRHWLQSGNSLYGYNILGVVTFLQLLLSFTHHIYDSLSKTKLKTDTISKKMFSSESSNSSKIGSTPPCSLCLELRQNTSLTTCGHLFCWDCVMDWLDEKSECPICRDVLKKSNVVQLQNYL